MKLSVEEHMNGDLGIYWVDDGGIGGCLGQNSTDGILNEPKDRDEWEHWAASRAVRALPSTVLSKEGFTWATLKQAKAALTVANAALKQKRPMPDWAYKALAEGWKAPKGWKP